MQSDHFYAFLASEKENCQYCNCVIRRLFKQLSWKKFLFPVHQPGENLFRRQPGANFFSYIIVRLAMIFCLLFTFYLHISFFLKRSIRSNNSSIDSRWVYCVTFFINRMFTFFVVHFGVRFTGTLVVSVTIFWSGQAWNRKWIKCLHHQKQEIEMVDLHFSY